MRERFAEPEAVLAVVLEAAELTPREGHVVRERLHGRSFEDITRDRALGRPYTKQALAKIEERALGKLGVDRSIESIVRHCAAEGFRESARRMGQDAEYRGLRADPVDRTLTREKAEPEEQHLEDWARYLVHTASEHIRLTPQQKADFDRMIQAGKQPPCLIRWSVAV